MEVLKMGFGQKRYLWSLHISFEENSRESKWLTLSSCLLIWYSTKISWKLDNALHPRLGSPFHSRFFPDVTYGLRASARGGGNPNLTRQFLSTIPTLTEPSFSPFVNQGRQLCFPFLIWERKSDSGETLKAENQLGLPAVKALDILEGLGLSNIPIIGLTTVGATWQVWVGHICVPPRPEMKVRKPKTCFRTTLISLVYPPAHLLW